MKDKPYVAYRHPKSGLPPYEPIAEEDDVGYPETEAHKDPRIKHSTNNDALEAEREFRKHEPKLEEDPIYNKLLGNDRDRGAVFDEPVKGLKGGGAVKGSGRAMRGMRPTKYV